MTQLDETTRTAATNGQDLSALPPPPSHVDQPEPGPQRSRFSYGTVAGRGALLLSGIGLGLVGIHAMGFPTPACPLRSATGFPCPFCGLTHLASDLVGGQVGLIVRNDPAGLVLAVMLAVAVGAQVFAMVRRRGGPAFMTWRNAGLAVLAVLAAHWVTTIITGGMLTA